MTALGTAGAVRASSPERVLAVTEALCPDCLRRLPAERVVADGVVRLRRTCPDHGRIEPVVWRGAPDLEHWLRPKVPLHPARPLTAVDRGCPFDCGLCPDHRQTSCCVLLEVTGRCDLRCHVCFADAGHGRTADTSPDPSLAELEDRLARLVERAGQVSVQLSGGEPTLRDDLPQLVAAARRLGVEHLQLNTNGLRLGRDPVFARRLADAGLSTVFLQFDSTRAEADRQLRRRSLLGHRLAAVDACAAAGLGVVLVPTVVPGVNDGDLGAVVDLALSRVPVVRGVHVQPVSWFGRYRGLRRTAPRDEDRITLPEVMRALDAGTGGRVPVSAFAPPGGENAMCSFHANFVVMPDGALVATTRNASAGGCCPAPTPAGDGAARSRRTVARLWSGAPRDGGPDAAADGPVRPPVRRSLGGWDVLVERSRTHSFAVSGMAFQDVWTLDLERLRECYIHELDPQQRLVPFCAYNLTDAAGRPLYRPLHQPLHRPLHQPPAGPAPRTEASR